MILINNIVQFHASFPVGEIAPVTFAYVLAMIVSNLTGETSLTIKAMSDFIDNEDIIDKEGTEIYSELVDNDFDEAGWDPVIEDDDEDEDDIFGYHND